MPLEGQHGLTAEPVSALKTYTRTVMNPTLEEEDTAWFPLQGKTHFTLSVHRFTPPATPVASENVRVRVAVVPSYEQSPSGSHEGDLFIYDKIIPGDEWPLLEEFNNVNGVQVVVRLTALTDVERSYQVQYYATSV